MSQEYYKIISGNAEKQASISVSSMPVFLCYNLERHGFTNYKLFRRMFLEHFGNTPTQMRKQREIL